MTEEKKAVNLDDHPVVVRIKAILAASGGIENEAPPEGGLFNPACWDYLRGFKETWFLFKTDDTKWVEKIDEWCSIVQARTKGCSKYWVVAERGQVGVWAWGCSTDISPHRAFTVYGEVVS
jgi:hypothetical protein